LIQQNRAYLPEKITQEQFRRLTGKLYVNNNPEDAKVYEDMLLLLQDRLPDELTFRESYNLVAVAQKETRSRLLKILSENLPEQISVDDFASLVSFRGSNNDDSNRYIEALDLFFDRLPSKLSGRDFFYLLRAIKDGELLHAQIKRFSPRLESINAKHARILTDDLVPRESADHWKQKIMETLLPKIENP